MKLHLRYAHGLKCACTVLSGKRKKACGTCTGCLHGNCGVCKFCLDMPVFSGPGRRKQHVQKMQHLWNSRRATGYSRSLFQVPVYMLTFSRQQNGYIWHCYQARDSSKLKFPETEPPPTHLYNLDRAELLHVRACHFDVILHEEEGFPLDRPVLEAARLSIKLD